VARATVAAVPFPDASFDIVTSFDVLYCLDEPTERAAAAEMWRVLRPGGSAIVNVAAMPVLKGSHSILAGERRRYDRPRLRTLLESAGFRIDRLTYTNATLVPAMLAVRLAQRAVGFASEEEATTEITVPAAPVNALLSAVLAAEAAVQRATPLPFGSSLLCRATKPA
jgi:SAM-dependent methyltransferase